VNKTQLIALAKVLAAQASIDPVLVCAVIEQESSWNPWSIRYEPAFYSRYIAPLNLGDTTEARARSFSWGLMQVMGEVAREEGYVGNLAMLCDPTTGIKAGITHLHRKLTGASGDVEAALQAWNGGGNPAYAGQVMARMVNYS
jgi:soluble lytic murein transglycosylase-like protein